MVTFVAGFVSPAAARWMNETVEQITDAGGNPGDWIEFEAAAAERRLTVPMPSTTIADVVLHLEHVRAVAGIEHVGIGGDFDGTSMLPDGLTDVGGYPRLFDALRERKWSPGEIEQLSRGNALRVLRAAEATATR